MKSCKIKNYLVFIGALIIVYSGCEGLSNASRKNKEKVSAKDKSETGDGKDIDGKPIKTPASTSTMLPGSDRADSSALKAFPGAEGFGSDTKGGRGGKVFIVSNLEDSGTGSFREAVMANGPRIVVFSVGGVIKIKTRIEVTSPFLTVAGQTAPGDGITITNDASNDKGPLRINANDVILRYLRIRSTPGTIQSDTLDALTMYPGPGNIIVDHCSFSWGVDEVFQTGGAHDFTIQWSIVAEGLNNSVHPEGDHSKGMHFRDENSDNITAHHNLLAHNVDRNPNVNSSGIVDLVNNLFYNATRWTEIKDKFGEPKVNVVGNFYKMGPSTAEDNSEVFYYNSTGRNPKVYVKGNIEFSRPDDSQPEENIIEDSPESRKMWVGKDGPAFPTPAVTTTTAAVAFEEVLSNAGAILLKRDRHDIRVCDNVRNGDGKVIDNPSEVGALDDFNEFKSNTKDEDMDGMPDAWETLSLPHPTDT